jgi:fibronectin type 3 domain-containing protein
VGYNVYRSTVSGGPYTKINSSIVTGTSYADSTALTNIVYYYVVTAVTPALESPGSNQASANIPPG